MSRSNFSPMGLNIGNNTSNMSYLYGISDFFSVMFEDTSRVNLLLESNSEIASAAYSKFLQMASSISLEDIQTTLNQTLKLITIKSSDKVAGQVNLYKLPVEALSSRYIANRPLLPTTLFEQGVDYRLERTDSGEYRVRFAKDISDAGFSTRLLKDGTTKEYAMWLVDSEIDEKWISNHYGDLIGIQPETSTEVFKNFVYGLYYIYLHGPTLDLMRKGLNMCLGVPLARDDEKVLDVRKYLETDQYIVVTDSNQYLIPYGLVPSIKEGDTLKVGDELALWVEIKDYIRDGSWWINLKIPEGLIPLLPAGQKDRYATKGSHFDTLMRTYLKTHTFLVNVKVTNFKNSQVFSQLSDIINQAKPSYTDAIYIWTIPNDEEFIINDDVITHRKDQVRYENITSGIEHFFRNNEINPHSRGNTIFQRYSVPNYVSRLNGTDPYSNSNPFSFLGKPARGFVNPSHRVRDNTDIEKGWMRTLLNRNNEMATTTRDRIGFFRDIPSWIPSDSVNSGLPVYSLHKTLNIPQNMRIVPMYVTTQADLKEKCDTVGIFTPDLKEWHFELMNPRSGAYAINELGVNEGGPNEGSSLLMEYYNVFNKRGVNAQYLSNFMPDQAYEIVAPKLSDMTSWDYLVGVRIHDHVVGIYMVMNNNVPGSQMYSIVCENDELVISIDTPPSRNLVRSPSAFYLFRGRGNLDYNNPMTDINARAINEVVPWGDNLIDTAYSDTANTFPRTMNRSGANLMHRIELK